MSKQKSSAKGQISSYSLQINAFCYNLYTTIRGTMKKKNTVLVFLKMEQVPDELKFYSLYTNSCVPLALIL